MTKMKDKTENPDNSLYCVNCKKIMLQDTSYFYNLALDDFKKEFEGSIHEELINSIIKRLRK